MKAIAFTSKKMRYRFALFATSAGLNEENGTSLKKSLCLSIASLGFLEVERTQ